MEGAVCCTYLLAAVPGRCDDSGNRYGGGSMQYLPTSGLVWVGVMTVRNRYGGGSMQYLPTSGCAG